MSNLIIELSFSHVSNLNRIVQKNGHKDLASFLTSEPGQGVAFLLHTMEAMVSGDKVRVKAHGPEGSTTTTDPVVKKQITDTFLTNYAGRTVEVKLQEKRLGGYRTITIKVPSA